MKFVPTGVSRFVGRQVLKTQKNSPTILFAVGVVGMVATTVAASRATLRLEDEVLIPAQKAKADLQVGLTKFDSIDEGQELFSIYTKAAGRTLKLYAPSIGLGVVSILCLTKSHNILKERNAGLAAAYAASMASLQEYRKRVADEFGEEKENEIYHAMEKGVATFTDEDGVVHELKGKMATRGSASPTRLFFDETCKNWKRSPGYNQMWLNMQEDYANAKLRANGHLFLNEVLEVIDGARRHCPEGQVLGWVYDPEKVHQVDFGIFRDNSFNGTRFVNGEEASIILDFNVDGYILDKI